MRAIFRVLTIASIIVPVAATAADSVQMTPGRWHETLRLTGMTLEGQSVPVEGNKANNSTRLNCITPEMARNPKLFFAEIQPGDGCVLLEGSTVADGHLWIRGRCTMGEKVPFSMVVEGTYGAESYHVTLNGQGTMEGKAVTLSGIGDGQYVGPCKGDEQ